MFLYEGLAGAQKHLRVVLVGCGEQATNMIHNVLWYLDEVRVVGVGDTNRDRAAFAARRFGLSQSYQDLGEMLREVQADCAFIITIAKLQPVLALQCVKAGLHVYTEKPLGTDPEAVCRLLEAARENNRKIGVSFNKRYAAAYQDMKAAVETGEFGSPSAFMAKFIGGYRTNDTDLLRVGCCHFFDLARYLIGELEEVYAYQYRQREGRGMYAVSGKFAGGCVASMSFGSLGSWVNGYGMERVEVHGDRNMVCAENGRDFTWQKASVLKTPDTEAATNGTQAVIEEAVRVEIMRPNYANLGKLALKDFSINGNFGCIKAYVQALLNDTTPPVTGTDGLTALRLACVVEKSVSEKRAVGVEEIGF